VELHVIALGLWPLNNCHNLCAHTTHTANWSWSEVCRMLNSGRYAWNPFPCPCPCPCPCHIQHSTTDEQCILAAQI